MYTLVLLVHILVSIFLVMVILFQQPQKGGMGTVFGSGESIFGGGGAAPFMTKLTSIVAGIFVVTSLTLVLLSAQRPPAPGRVRVAPTGPIPTAPVGPTTPTQEPTYPSPEDEGGGQ